MQVLEESACMGVCYMYIAVDSIMPLLLSVTQYVYSVIINFVGKVCIQNTGGKKINAQRHC